MAANDKDKAQTGEAQPQKAPSIAQEVQARLQEETRKRIVEEQVQEGLREFELERTGGGGMSRPTAVAETDNPYALEEGEQIAYADAAGVWRLPNGQVVPKQFVKPGGKVHAQAVLALTQPALASGVGIPELEKLLEQMKRAQAAQQPQKPVDDSVTREGAPPPSSIPTGGTQPTA